MSQPFETAVKIIDESNDPLGVREILKNFQTLANSDAQEASQLLSSLSRDIKDIVLRIDSLVASLEEKIPQWSEESNHRLMNETQRYFDDEIQRIENAIENEVGYGTPFSEMKESLSNHFSEWNDKRKLKKAIKDFFRKSDYNPELKKEWSEWCNRRDYTTYFEDYIRSSYTLINDDIRLKAKNIVQERIRHIEQSGLAEYEKLVRTGFFEIDPKSQKEKILEFDSSLLEEFIKRGWIEIEPQMKFGTGLVGLQLEKSFGEEALNRFRDNFFSKENVQFESFWKTELTRSSQRLPNIDKHLKISQRDEVRPNISAEAAAAVLAAAAPLAAAGVLAAGWHTMAWAMSNFFPPMLLATIPIAVFAVVKGKENTATNMKREVRNFCDRMLASQKMSIKVDYYNQSEKTARQFVDNFKSNAYINSVGISSKRSIYDFIECLDNFGSGLQLEILPRRIDFLRLCYECLRTGNGFDAASLSVQAFESCVEQWLEKHSIPFPRHSDFLRRSISQLRRHSEVPGNVPEQLDFLRRIRNKWAHGMDDLFGLTEHERKRRVAEVLDKIRSVMPEEL